MESRYLIDWFSLTSKILSPDDWVNLLGFHGLGLKEIRGVHGFPNRLYYDGVNINFPGWNSAARDAGSLNLMAAGIGMV